LSDTTHNYLKTLARLRRVNKQLAAWDELDSSELMPPTLRPHVLQPMLDRNQLKSLQLVLIDRLREIDLEQELERARST
jgi:hypothetical protein